MLPRISRNPPRSPQAPADAASCCAVGETPARPAAAGTAAGIAAATSATAIVACSACCVIPLAFPAFAAAVGGTALMWFGQTQRWMTGLAVLVTAAAWIWIGRQRRHGRRLSGAAFALMSIASAGALLAIAWPRLEPYLMGALLK